MALYTIPFGCLRVESPMTTSSPASESQLRHQAKPQPKPSGQARVYKNSIMHACNRGSVCMYTHATIDKAAVRSSAFQASVPASGAGKQSYENERVCLFSSIKSSISIHTEATNSKSFAKMSTASSELSPVKDALNRVALVSAERTSRA